MARVDLQSTSLNAATYQDQDGFLELEFRSGAIYRYLGVPEQVYQELLSAESKGRYFNQQIRNRFPYVEINPTLNGPSPVPSFTRAPSNPL
jgi:KTSC domain